MKFLPLLSAVLLSVALVSAESPVAAGEDRGKVPQLIDLINKLEHANPASPAFLTQYAADIPQLAKLHHEVVAQSGEKQVKKLYGDDEAAQKLLEIVHGVKTEEKREVKPKKSAHKKGSSRKHTTKKEAAKKHTAKKETSKKEHKSHPNTHGDAVNKLQHGTKPSAPHKTSHASHPGHTAKSTEKTKRAETTKPKKIGTAKKAEHKKEDAKKHHAAHPKTKGDAVNKHKQGEKQSSAHKSTHAHHKAKQDNKQNKKPAHKHKHKSAKSGSS